MNRDALCKCIEQDLKKNKKKDLEKISKLLEIPVQVNNRKQKQITDFADKIYQLIVNNKRNGIPEEFTITEICSRVQSEFPSLGPQLKKKLMMYLENSRQGTFNNPYLNMNAPMNGMGIPTHNLNMGHYSPNLGSVLKRNIYGNNQYFVENLVRMPRCLCNSMYIVQNSVQCFVCRNNFHKNCIKPLQNQTFQCPFCYCTLMDPMNQVKQSIFLGYLRIDSKVHKMSFNLSQQDIADPNKQLQIRCLRLDGKNNYQLTWPDYGDLRVNEFKVCDFKPLVYNSSLKRRRDESRIVDKKLLRQSNCLQITEFTAPARQQLRVGSYMHFIGVFLVSVHKPDQFIKQISQIYLEQEQSRALFQKQFDSVDQIEVQRIDISVKCVFEFVKIRVPARSKFCTHFQCFDLQNMVKVTSKTLPRRWRCPICRKKSHLLLVDPILMKILKQNQKKNLSDISFFKDGSFKLIQEKESEEQQSSPKIRQKESKKQTFICLDDEDFNQNQAQAQLPMFGNSPHYLQQNQIHFDGFEYEVDKIQIVQQNKLKKASDKNIETKQQKNETYENLKGLNQKKQQNKPDYEQLNNLDPSQNCQMYLKNINSFSVNTKESLNLNSYYFNKLLKANHTYPNFVQTGYNPNLNRMMPPVNMMNHQELSNLNPMLSINNPLPPMITPNTMLPSDKGYNQSDTINPSMNLNFPPKNPYLNNNIPVQFLNSNQIGNYPSNQYINPNIPPNQYLNQSNLMNMNSNINPNINPNMNSSINSSNMNPNLSINSSNINPNLLSNQISNIPSNAYLPNKYMPPIVSNSNLPMSNQQLILQNQVFSNSNIPLGNQNSGKQIINQSNKKNEIIPEIQDTQNFINPNTTLNNNNSIMPPMPPFNPNSVQSSNMNQLITFYTMNNKGMPNMISRFDESTNAKYNVNSFGNQRPIHPNNSLNKMPPHNMVNKVASTYSNQQDKLKKISTIKQNSAVLSQKQKMNAKLLTLDKKKTISTQKKSEVIEILDSDQETDQQRKNRILNEQKNLLVGLSKGFQEVKSINEKDCLQLNQLTKKYFT